MLTDSGIAIPGVIVGGYLGAGKTSLVNHLLRHAMGMRIAVLVNDFGDLPIDADLIEAQHGSVMSLSGGCVCCSFGADLVGSLQQVLAGTPPPDIVLIETSGVGLPAAVARSARLAFGLSIEAIVVVADAQAIEEQCANPYLADTVAQQLREADLVLINKADLLESTELLAVESWLQTQLPRIRTVTCSRAEVPSELVLGLRLGQQLGQHSAGTLTTAPLTGFTNAQSKYSSASFSDLPPLDLQALAQKVLALGPGLLRAKGILRDLSGQVMTLQLAGGRVEIAPYSGLAHNAFVLIGLRHLVSEAEMATLFQGGVS